MWTSPKDESVPLGADRNTTVTKKYLGGIPSSTRARAIGQSQLDKTLFMVLIGVMPRNSGEVVERCAAPWMGASPLGQGWLV